MVSKRGADKEPSMHIHIGRQKQQLNGRGKKLWSGEHKKQSPTEELGKVPPSIFISDPNA